MIITLAGHVDHGKTSLVKALTGTDTDRLAEEKARGLTIDLGFAYADLDGQRIGFVDVPGHHRFIHNMVAGVASMQHALLVIAADDGVMPQTREHLQILSLLGLRTGTVALTKIDRVGADLVAQRSDEIRTFLRGSFLADANIIEVSSEDSRGIPALRAELIEQAAAQQTQASTGTFRLAIDRSFSVRGVGAVVTGTVIDGTVHVDDTLVIGASGATSGTQVRARGLHVQDHEASSAHVGDRCAINLAGIAADDIRRGDWLLDEHALQPSDNITVELTVLDDFPRNVRHWSPVHVYHATSHTQARLSLLEGPVVAPGDSQLADLVCEEPMQTKVGDALIIRDHDLGRTLGGGLTIDTLAPVMRRRNKTRIATLQQIVNPVHEQTPARALSIQSRVAPVAIDGFRRSWNIASANQASLIDDTAVLTRDGFALHREYLTERLESCIGILRDHHESHPDSQGLELESLATLSGNTTTATKLVLDHAVETEQARLRSGQYSMAAHEAEIPAALKSLFETVEPLLDEQQPPSLGDMAKQLSIPLSRLERDFRALVGLRMCIQISPNRFFLPSRLATMTQTAIDLSAEGGFTVRAFRDAAGMGRNVVIEVLEYFDGKGFTRRAGDERTVVGDAARVLT